MLILSRKAQQEIVIGPNIIVRVKSIKGAVVQLSVDAPKETKILRGELRRYRAA